VREVWFVLICYLRQGRFAACVLAQRSGAPTAGLLSRFHVFAAGCGPRF